MVSDESSTTRASLLTVSLHSLLYCSPLLLNKSRSSTEKSDFYCFSCSSFILSAPSTVTMLMKTAGYTAQASASPPSLWTARSGQPRAATATWLMHSGTSRSLTARLLVIPCCMLCAFHIRSLGSYLLFCIVSQILIHLNAHTVAHVVYAHGHFEHISCFSFSHVCLLRVTRVHLLALMMMLSFANSWHVAWNKVKSSN